MYVITLVDFCLIKPFVPVLMIKFHHIKKELVFPINTICMIIVEAFGTEPIKFML